MSKYNTFFHDNIANTCSQVLILLVIDTKRLGLLSLYFSIQCSNNLHLRKLRFHLALFSTPICANITGLHHWNDLFVA